jgi:hypothetical protein
MSMMNSLRVAPARHRWLAWALAVFAAPSFAGTYYVNASAADDSGDGSSARPKKYIGSGAALFASGGGNVLIVSPGTYSNSKDDVSSAPAGKAGAYNIIRAATDGTVVIKSAFGFSSADHYLQLEGLKWDSSGQKSIEGRYLKFMRCAFKGGPSSGNVVSLLIGTNDRTPGAQYILLEDSWVYGPGGRYKILVYNSDSIVLRRVVVRHDGGWTYDNNNPQAGITSYNSRNVRLQNVMVVDSQTGLAGFESNIYLVGNASSSTPPSNVKLSGAIVIGGGGNGIAIDDHVAYSNVTIEDSAIWGSSSGGFASNGASHKATVNRMFVKSGGTAYADWESAGGITVKNSIAYQSSGSAFTAVSGSFNVAYGNGSNSGGTSLNPLTNGMKYLPRVEDGSVLKTLGEGGGQVGPQIVKRIGASGALYGEPGFEDVTSQNLWPWPSESRIKSDFAEVSTRGFAGSSGTLTDYVWGILGNGNPITPVVTPNPPTDVAVQ